MSEEKYPEWLKCLQGDSPLLSRQDWMFITGICSQIRKEIKSKPNIVIDEGVILKEKLSVVKDNFKQVVKYLKLNRTRRQYFIDMYPKWRMLRDYNIESLRKIGKSIQEVRQKCQIANFVGSCVSFIGGGILLASGFRDNRLAQFNGSAMVGLGSLTSTGSSVIELGLLYSKIEEAEKILKEDKECSEHLWEWLSDSTHLQEAMDNIRYIDVEINLKHAADVMQEASKKKRDKTVVEKIVRGVLNTCKVSHGLANEISEVIGILMATSMLFDRYRPLFDLSLASVRLSVRLNTCISLCRAAFAGMPAVSRRRSTQELKTRVVVGMVLDFINVLHTCGDFEPKSEQAVKVIEAAGTLEKEAKIFETLYMEVRCINDTNFPQSLESTC